MRIINPFFIFRILSIILFIESISLLLCIPVAIAYHEPYYPFTGASLLSFIPSCIFFLLSRNKNFGEINMREGYLVVTLSWVVISLFGISPYVISGYIPSFINALFESTSGFTTTGASILTDIEILPKSVLYWRSLTHWIGGIGIILLVIIILPSMNIGGHKIFSLESSVREKTHPRIQSIGLRLLYIYLLLTVAEIILLFLGGMNFYESMCHAFGTVATGGFSPKNASIAFYSPYLQYVIMLFMVLSGMNFLLHYFFLKRKFKKVFFDEEFLLYLSIIFISGIIITGGLIIKKSMPFELAFRESFFQVISIITSTGFATCDYLQWPSYAWMIIFFLMFLGGCTGSTSGGIKMTRHLLLLKNIRLIFKKMNFPNSVHGLKLNKQEVSPAYNNSTLIFIFTYIGVFVLGSILLVAMRIDGRTAIGAVATTMGGIGPGLGTVGPVNNFYHLPQIAKLLLIFLMIVGRLEIFTVFVIFSPAFWKK